MPCHGCVVSTSSISVGMYVSWPVTGKSASQPTSEWVMHGRIPRKSLSCFSPWFAVASPIIGQINAEQKLCHKTYWLCRSLCGAVALMLLVGVVAIVGGDATNDSAAVAVGGKSWSGSVSCRTRTSEINDGVKLHRKRPQDEVKNCCAELSCAVLQFGATSAWTGVWISSWVDDGRGVAVDVCSVVCLRVNSKS